MQENKGGPSDISNSVIFQGGHMVFHTTRRGRLYEKITKVHIYDIHHRGLIISFDRRLGVRNREIH